MKRNIILSIIALFMCTPAIKADNDLYRKMVLLEEFTTEQCPNCPSCAAMLEEIMAMPEYENKLIAVTHHAGYYTDQLTTEADIEYKWFYNYKATYAPAMMFDRFPFFETKGRPGTDQRKPTPVSHMDNTDQFKKYIGRRLDIPAHAGFYITGQFEDDNTVKVCVSGGRDSVFCDTDARITVYLVENNIKAERQAGAQGDFYHNHVLREYNSIWGDVITWNGDTFEYECSLNVKPEWKKENMQLVAFIHAMDREKPGNCVIENARIVDYDTMLGIEDAAINNGAARTEYFTLDGIRTNSVNQGLYIQKKTFADGSVETKKIMR